MTTTNDIPILQRPAFFSGQQLRAADLGAVAAYHRELSWLHNRSLHNWGIATGYSVTGARGDSQVRVSTGFALDCQGHELILTSEQTIEAPAVAGNAAGEPQAYFLTVSWLDDELITAEQRAGICGTNGAVRRPETVLLRWQDPDDRVSGSPFRPGLDVVLAGVEVQACRLAAAISDAERRNAMPEEIPYVFAGQTAAGKTAWQPWPDSKDPIGYSTTVSTAAAGFGATPQYFAHVVGNRIFDVDNSQRNCVVEGYAEIANSSAAGFELRVFLPIGGWTSGLTGASAMELNPDKVVFGTGFSQKLEETLKWHVVWAGIEA